MEFAQADVFPVIALVEGTGFIVTVFVTGAPTHPNLFVSITCTVPVGPLPQVTDIELPVPLVGVPPVTVHA
jgi:hypothetical protein